MDSASLVDWSPLARMAFLGVAIALGPLLWVWLRHRGATPTKRLHALTLLIARQLVGEIEGLAPGIEHHIVPPLCPLEGSPYDFSHTAALIEQAAASTAQWLEGGGLDRQSIPDGLRAHKHH